MWYIPFEQEKLVLTAGASSESIDLVRSRETYAEHIYSAVSLCACWFGIHPDLPDKEWSGCVLRANTTVFDGGRGRARGGNKITPLPCLPCFQRRRHQNCVLLSSVLASQFSRGALEKSELIINT